MDLAQGRLMRAVNIHDAKTHFSCLVQLAAEGEPYVIANAAWPLVRMVPISRNEPRPIRRVLGSRRFRPDGVWRDRDYIRGISVNLPLDIDLPLRVAAEGFGLAAARNSNS